jgi:hypothetical protein
MRSRSLRTNYTSIQAVQHFTLGHCQHVCKARRTSRLRFFLCSVDRASLYNIVNEIKLVHDLFLVYFVNLIYNLYMFRSSPSTSSGGTTVFMRHLVLVIPYSWLSGMQDGMHSSLHTRQSAIQNNKYQVSHKYSCSSWWWTWRRPKHVKVINKIDEIH